MTPNQIYLPIDKLDTYREFSTDIEAQLQDFFDTPIGISALDENETGNTLAIHAPYSLLHLEVAEEYTGEDANFSTGLNNEPLYHYEKEKPLYAPRTATVGDQFLRDYIKNKLGKVTTPKLEESIIKLVTEWESKHVQQGEYQPIPFYMEGQKLALDPLKFTLAYLLKIKEEVLQTKHTGEINLVFHPDILFFLGNGKGNAVQKAARVLAKLSTQLGLNIVYENVVFKKESYKKALGWMEHPVAINELLERVGSTSGICIDIQHLSKIGYPPGVVLYILRTLRDKGRKLLIHTRKNMGIENDTWKKIVEEAYIYGIPIVYEPEMENA